MGEPIEAGLRERIAETEEERADREETERDHARGDHTHCGITCEAEMPTEHLRNFVIAKGYPGTKGALDELLRRSRADALRAERDRLAAEVAEAREQLRLVFAECDAIEREVHGQHDEDADGMREAVRRVRAAAGITTSAEEPDPRCEALLRAALDGTEEPRE